MPRSGNGASGDITDYYTHIDEMIGDMLTRQTQR
jgi:hypothetical protein